MITIKQGLIGNDGTNKWAEPGIVKDGEGAAALLAFKMGKCLPPFVPQATPGYPTHLMVVRSGFPGERTFIASFEGEAEEMRPLFRKAVGSLLTVERQVSMDRAVRRLLVVSMLEPDAKEALVVRLTSSRAFLPLSDEDFLALVERKLEQPHLRFADMVCERSGKTDPTAR